jgi:hypothetical protein
MTMLNNYGDNTPDWESGAGGRISKWIPASILAVFLISIGLYSVSLSGRYKPTPDSAEYVGFAQSLARGQGYTFNGRDQSCYPPLLSLIAIEPMWIADRSGRPEAAIIPLKVILFCAAILFAVGSIGLGFYYLKTIEWVWIGVMVLTNIAVFQHCQYIISDMLYAALALTAIVLVIERDGWGRWLAASGLLGLACLARSVGLFAVMGFALALLFGKWEHLKLRERLARLAVMLPIALAGFTYWRMRYGSADDNYIARWQNLTGKTPIVEIVWDRFVSQLSVVPLRSVQIVLNIEQIALPMSFIAVVFLLILLGWGIQFVRRRALPEWCVLSYMAIMSIWFDQGPRFFLPMLPFFLIYLFTAIDWLAERFSRTGPRARIGVLMGLVTAAVLLSPLIFYKIQHGRFPSPMALLREGIIYSLIASVWGIIALISLFVKFSGRWAHRLKANFIVVSVSLGILYMAGYAIFEHGLMKSRGPMLEGYMPYYRMGQWLKDQPEAAEPVLCANASIVHLASGTITDQSGVLKEDQVLRKLDAGEYGSVLILEPHDRNISPDRENALLQNLIESGTDQFRLHATNPSPSGDRYYLYQYRPGH